MSTIYGITNHAKERARERAGLSKKTLKRLLPRILEEGLYFEELKGKLKEYAEKVIDGDQHTKVLFWGTYVFLLRLGGVVTVLYTPRELLPHVRIACKKKKTPESDLSIAS